MKHLTNLDLTSLLQAWAQKHGETPSRRQWHEDASTPVSEGIFRQRFGSWSEALKQAGLIIKKSVISPQCREATIKAHKGKRSTAWKGGRIVEKATGYILIWNPEHPNAKVGRGKGYVYEHRMVMSEILGRTLLPNEYVHHKNAIKDDNRPENLQVMLKKVHNGTVVCPHCEKEFAIR